MLSALFPATARRGALLLAALAGPLAGCQTAGQADPNSTVTASGDFQQLATCYARSQDAAATRPSAGADGVRSVTVTTVEPAPAAASALGSSASRAGAEAVGNAGVASYRVTFREMPGNTTQVSGASGGAATQPFTWFDKVLPALRECTGDADLR